MHKILINGAWVDALIETSREITKPATLKALGGLVTSPARGAPTGSNVIPQIGHL